jgi:hypothetical protein
MRWSILGALVCAGLLGCGGSSSGTPAYAERGVERARALTHPAEPSPYARPGGPQGISSAASAPVEASALSAGPVYVNGLKLADPDLRELEARLGQPPEPGRYWYDEKSGLWGLMGHGAGGVTKAGLRAGPLPSDASVGTSGGTPGGSTGVLINGREITRTELSVLARLVSWDEPKTGQYTGRYTLDENGQLYGPANRYLGNLVQAAARIQAAVTAKSECAWLRLSAKEDSLGRAVTVACD